MRCSGTSWRVRYRLSSSRFGSSSRSRSRMVTFGQTISTVSEYAAACGCATLFRIDHAHSMPITVVLPLPVAIFSAWRTKAL